MNFFKSRWAVVVAIALILAVVMFLGVLTPLVAAIVFVCCIIAFVIFVTWDELKAFFNQIDW